MAMHPEVPENEDDRLATLLRLDLLDTNSEPEFDGITQIASKLFRVPISLISLVDEGRQWFKSKVGLDVCETPREYSFCAHAINNTEVFLVNNTEEDPRFCDNPLVTGPPHIRFYAGAPLITPSGHAIGTVCIIDTKARRKLTKDEEKNLSYLARLTIKQIILSRSLWFTDSISGLPNRKWLIDDLDHIIDRLENSDKSIKTIIIDAAEAKRYANFVTALGHKNSDLFILAVARSLEEILPKETRVYHLGVFRFAIILQSESNYEHSHIISRVAKRLEEPFYCGPLPLRLGGAVGIAGYPKDATSSSELIRAGISATHNAIDTNTTASTYNSAQDKSYQHAFKLLCDLPAALNKAGELKLVFQPKINLFTGECVGAEALIRWYHPELGFIPPDEFITLAEQTDLILNITDWVVNAAFKQISEWMKKDLNIKLSINISATDLEESSFTTKLLEKLKHYKVPPYLVELEVTETSIINNLDVSIRKLNQLREAGIDIAIDDFGTGHSSYSYMKNIPADTIKIDRTFIKETNKDKKDQLIVKSIIELSKGLGFNVIAEGIETTETKNWLASHGCCYGQGYLISRPISGSEFESWLDTNSYR